MILVTVGTHRMPFDRLLTAVDAARRDTALGREEMTVQSGPSLHRIPGVRQVPYLPDAEFDALLAGAELVITHGGIGTVLTALRLRRRVIAVPRLRRFGEHNSDHQVQLCRELGRRRVLFTTEDTARLPELLVRDPAELRPFEPPRAVVDSVRDDLRAFARRRAAR